MIKFLQFLSKNKPLVILVLCLPILGFFFQSRFQFDLLPQDPYPKFKVEFKVPHRTAKEIVPRVTEPAEKIFNGLPGLISLESETRDHSASMALIFKREVPPDHAYLYLQEKLDRVKLEVPSDVDSISVERVTPPLAADLKIEFEPPTTAPRIRQALGPLFSHIQKSEPSLIDEVKIEIFPDALKLSREGLSVTQLTQALKLSGISTDLGSQSGVMFGIGRGFSNFGDIQRVVIGSRDSRPILLSDVATVKLSAPPTVKNLELWYDSARVSTSQILDSLERIEGERPHELSVKRPYLRQFFKFLWQPLLGLVIVLVLQIYFLQFALGRKLPWTALALFDGFLTAHFLFWRGLSLGGLTVLDFHSLIGTLIIATMFWVILFCRVRTYFLEPYQLKKIPRSMEQASLLSLGELLPSYFVLVLALWLLDLPVMLGHVNEASTYILDGFFKVGMPVTFAILVFMPILTDFDWIKDSGRLPLMDRFLNQIRLGRELGGRAWKENAKETRWVMTGLHLLAVFALIGVFYFRVGVHSEQNSEMVHYRGYGKRLDFGMSPIQKVNYGDIGVEPYRLNRKSLYQVWEFTPGGLRYLPHLDLTSLAPSVKELESRGTVGTLLEGEQDALLIKWGALGFGSDDLGSMLLAPRGEEKPKMLRALAESKSEWSPSIVIRNRMNSVDIVHRPALVLYDNLRASPGGEVVPTQWSENIIDRFRKFSEFHFMVLVFLYLLISLYLNSFLRAGILVVYALALMGGVMLFYLAMPGAYFADSLWMVYLVPWFTLAGYLIFSRAVDLERSRGHDRDLALEEVRAQFAPSIALSLVFSVICQFGVGLLDWIPGLPSMGVWREAPLCALLGAAGLVLLFRNIFPVVYLRSEEFIDAIMLWLVKLPFLKKLFRQSV